MINQLVKKFIKNYNDCENSEVRTAYGKLSSIVGIICNAILFIGKIIVGTLSGALSVTADAVNNLSDASSSIISLFGFKLASRPADEEHPYGHGRYEYLSALMVVFLIMVIGIEILKSSIEKIITPTAVEFGWVTVCVLIFSILLKLWMMCFNNKIGKRINSKTLIATAADSRNDVITTSSVLIALVVSHFADINLDGWMGLAVAAFILYSGFGLLKDTLDPLLGKAPRENQVNKIRDKILSYPGVLGTHDLMIHDYGPGRQFGSVHVEMAAEADMLESHDVIDNIERDFRENDGLHMVIHLDPISTKDTLVNELRTWISEQIKHLDERLTIHDLRIVKGPTHTNVIFDCVVPYDMEIGQKEIKHFLRNVIKEKYPTYYAVVTIDRSYAAMPH